MFKARLSASEKTDVIHELDSLERRAGSKQLSPAQVVDLRQRVGEALASLVERGQALAANRSQMTVDRRVDGPGYRVDIHFQTGGQGEGVLARIRRLMGM